MKNKSLYDFWANVVFRPQKCFLAPDGRTIILQQYALARSTSLIEAVPGKKVYLSDAKIFAERGEFGVAVDAAGNVYIADGEVLVHRSNGDYKRTIKVSERPSAMTIVGNKLYITPRNGLYVHGI